MSDTARPEELAFAQHMQVAQRERDEEAAREARRAAMRAEMAESNRLQLQLKVCGRQSL